MVTAAVEYLLRITQRKNKVLSPFYLMTLLLSHHLSHCVSVIQLFSHPALPSLPAPIDSSACGEMKKPDHLARAFQLFMSPKYLALFTKLSGTVCLESLITPVRLCREKKSSPFINFSILLFFILAYFLREYVKLCILAIALPFWLCN